MPINHSIWKITNGIQVVSETTLAFESELESVLQEKIEILDENWLVIGRQVLTSFSKYIDLLAIDATGSLIIIELKRYKTPRDVVAQSIDYASWVKTLSPDQVSDIFEAFDSKYLKSRKSLDEAFLAKFRTELDDESLNASHQIVIVATELDSSTERIVTYLSDSNVPINVVFFKVVLIHNEKYISRAWFIDPRETAEIAAKGESKEPWNGEYYISFGNGTERNWDDAVKYGFISGGGRAWYSRTLNLLKEGDRVWVNIPRVGYVGVGKVIATAMKADQVKFQHNGQEGTIYDLPKNADYLQQNLSSDDNAEYIVRIEWIKTVKVDKAVKEVGFFGNQNTVCKPTANKWIHTVERLQNLWNIR